MQRLAYKELVDWKRRPNHKPLIIRGARQVGKTWLMKAFGSREYEQIAYINLESSKTMHALFELDFDLHRLIRGLQIETGVLIQPDTTLIVLDEIQECPAALTALKYFQENAPSFDIIAAGSLLGVAMHQVVSFPVGKVEFLDLYPLTFHEYLVASANEPLLQMMKDSDWEMVTAFKQKLIELLRQYYFIGGMPEAVNHFIQTNDYHGVRVIQQRLLDAYEQDFSKHAPYDQLPRIRMVWQSIISQLAKENSKFIYSALRQGARAKDFELALAWLADAGLIHKVTRISKPSLPLAAYEDINDFKIYLFDVGLLAAMGKLDPSVILKENDLFIEFKGTLSEQYVLQQIVANHITPHYWTVEKSKAEVDFVIQLKNAVIPVEVKAAENLRSKSLRVFYDTFNPSRVVRTSLSDFKTQDWMTNIPLYVFPIGLDCPTSHKW
ncbi:MAG: ATP-binding protein [Saprospiraceae bacterium]|nr:ATP-binding protein [Saprospiraceae bacterium]